MNVHALLEAKKAERTKKGLHVRVFYDDHLPFDYYAVDEKQRDDFIRRCEARGHATEIM